MADQTTRIRVQAKAREGFVERWCAGRCFSTATPTELEVLSQEEDFEVHRTDGGVTYDPETTLEVVTREDPIDRRPVKEMRPHPGRIGQAGLRAILADPVLVTSPVA